MLTITNCSFLEKRKKLSLLLVLVFISSFVFSQATIRFISPEKPYNYYSNKLTLTVQVSSPYDLNSVTAKILSLPISLIQDPSRPGYYNGWVENMTTLPNDTLPLTVYVKDVLNRMDSVVMPIIHNPAPVIQLISPVYTLSPLYYVEPRFHLKARCQDNSPGCRLRFYTIGSSFDTVLFNQTVDSVDTVLDLSRYTGKINTFWLTATDTNLAKSTLTMKMLVESSPYLIPYYRAENEIIDFKYNKVLSGRYSEQSISTNTFYDHIKLTALKDSSADLFNPYKTIIYGFIRPDDKGAFLASFNQNLFQLTLSQWHGNYLDTFYKQGAHTPIYAQSKGHYIAWIYTDLDYAYRLRYRDITQSADALVATGTYPEFLLTESGKLFYRDNNKIMIYDNNGLRVFLEASADIGAITGDEKDLVYTITDRYSSYRSIFRYSPVTGKNEVIDVISESMRGTFGLQAVKGYIAYTLPGSSSQSVIWRRDPFGNKKQITPFSDNCSLDLLNEKGEMVFTRVDIYNNTYKYFVDSSGRYTLIAHGGTPKYENNQWYLQMGPTLYRINTQVPAPYIEPVAISVNKNMPYTFKGEELINAYKGTGEPIRFRFTNIPHHGKLVLGTDTLPANSELFRSDLPKLKYIPRTGFTGNDTIWWNVFDGVDYTPKDTLLIFSIKDSASEPAFQFGDLGVTTSGKTNILNWYTLKENGASRFEVEKSNDAITFNKVGSVPAAGNSTQRTNYSFTDQYPLKGINYYRLKIIDREGKATYSKMVSKTNNDVFDIYVYPNPIQGQFNVCINTAKGEQVQIIFNDIMGNILAAKQVATQPGINRIPFTAAAQATGLYYVRVISQTKITTIPVLKIK
jgi:hypothetical protein